MPAKVKARLSPAPSEEAKMAELRLRFTSKLKAYWVLLNLLESRLDVLLIVFKSFSDFVEKFPAYDSIFTVAVLIELNYFTNA